MTKYQWTGGSPKRKIWLPCTRPSTFRQARSSFIMIECFWCRKRMANAREISEYPEAGRISGKPSPHARRDSYSNRLTSLPNLTISCISASSKKQPTTAWTSISHVWCNSILRLPSTILNFASANSMATNGCIYPSTSSSASRTQWALSISYPSISANCTETGSISKLGKPMRLPLRGTHRQGIK